MSTFGIPRAYNDLAARVKQKAPERGENVLSESLYGLDKYLQSYQVEYWYSLWFVFEHW
jgi:hypothetical protein